MTATSLPQPRSTVRPVPTGPVLDVVIPVRDEQDDLATCVHRVHAYLSRELPFAAEEFRITIADNGSTDRTPQVAEELAALYPRVLVIHVPEPGRGGALRSVWLASDAQVLVYMDVDLSTDLAALPPLVAPLLSGHSDLAIGSRLARGARVVRGPKRGLISRCYNVLLRGTLATRFSDAQCGFKAIRADAAARLLPQVRDTGWFFDTELLVLAERAGLRIHEVPVDWVDDPESRVDLLATAIADLRGIARLLPGRFGRPGTGRLAEQVLQFAGIGVASTLAYLLLFVLLRTVTGAQQANLVALLLTAVANTAANRRLTFGVRGRRAVLRHHVQALVVFGIGLGLTAGALAGMQAVAPAPARAVELGVLVLANLAATVTRFVLLRLWVFRPAAPLAA